MNFEDFYHWFTYSGLEFFGKFYSFYEGTVESVEDPDKLGRIQVKVKKVGMDKQSPIWAYPAGFTGAGNQRGWFWPPEVGDFVWVAFLNGKIQDAPPIYFGGWFAKGELPSELGYGSQKYPTTRGFVTRMGHTFTFNDESGKEEIDLIWRKPKSAPEAKKSATRDGDKASLKFKPDGTIELLGKNESSLTINVTDKKIVVYDKDNDNTITLDSNGVTIKTSKKVVIDGASEFDAKVGQVKLGSGASKSAVYGDDLLQWLNSHTHPTGVGPSGPPTVQATPSLLSQSVKLK